MAALIVIHHGLLLVTIGLLSPAITYLAASGNETGRVQPASSFSLDAIEQEMIKMCPGVTSNNWAVDYAIRSNYTDAINLTVTAIPQSFYDIQDSRLGVRMEFSFSWDIGCPNNFTSFCRQWPQLDDSNGARMAEVLIQRQSIKSPPWKPRLRHENFDRDPHPFDSLITMVDFMPCYSSTNWVVPGMFWSRCRAIGNDRPPTQLSCPIRILSELTTDYLRFGSVQFFFPPYRSEPEKAAAEFMAFSPTWKVDPNLKFSVENYNPGDFSNYHRLTLWLNFTRISSPSNACSGSSNVDVAANSTDQLNNKTTKPNRCPP